MVIPSGFQELEVRIGHEAYGVNIHLKTSERDGLRLTSLASSLCLEIHYGKKTSNPPLLPPILRILPGRPKNRVKAQSENNSKVSRVGRRMTCTNCQETEVKVEGQGGIGVRGSRGEGSGGRGESSVAIGQGNDGMGQRACERAQRGTGRGKRDGGRGQRGGGRNGSKNENQMQKYEAMTDDEIRNHLEHEYMEEILLEDVTTVKFMLATIRVIITSSTKFTCVNYFMLVGSFLD
ncbi:hypothetical protein Tco_0097000 [Tanacetum coccineum]